ncbi:MAG TPA: hypothetical protein DCE71_05015 [Parachlamydiales bacterium]|nr:hypothetical protein [Parachlamydiales bacterium]
MSNLPTGATFNSIQSVSINSSAQSNLVGHFGAAGVGGGGYEAFVSSSGNVSVLPSVPVATFFHCSTNSARDSIAVGGDGARIGYRIDSMGVLSPISMPGGGGTLLASALNDSGLAVIGGPGYAAVVQPNSLTPGPSLSVANINSVAVNASGNSLLGGVNYAQFFDSQGNSIASVSLSGGPTLSSVAINDSNLSLIGGSTAGPVPYAGLVNLSGMPTLLSGLPSNGMIASVDINQFGYGIIGGQDGDTTSAYASFVDPAGVIYPISGLPIGTGASINSVAINDWGVALLGGTLDGSTAYAALVSPWGGITPLSLNAPQVIYSVSIRNFVPSNDLSGNNLAFAEYIKDYARNKIVYFIPSLLAGTLNEALESAAPTRNAASLFTADNNLFYLNHSLSTHLRNHWHFRNRKRALSQAAPAASSEIEPLLTESDVVAGCLPKRRSLQGCQPMVSCEEDRPYSFWLELIQARAFQDAQLQTPGFQASVGGGVLGFDGQIGEEVQAGLGMAYTFTHIHEKEGSGFSDLHQEYAFLYATWSDQQMYVDLACWGGAMQIHQVRNIYMTGWNFVSTSSVGGWQLAPHFEAGADYVPNKECIGPVKASAHWSANPFVMLDWISAWQERYQEKGSGPFNAAQKAHYSSFLRTEIGLRFYEPITFQAWRLVFEEKASFVNKTPFGVGKISAYLVGSPGSFTVETLTKPQNLGAVEFGIIMEPLDHKYPYGSLSYQGEFTTSSQLHQATLEVSLDF